MLKGLQFYTHKTTYPLAVLQLEHTPQTHFVKEFKECRVVVYICMVFSGDMKVEPTLIRQ